ncbi:MAG: asparagine synthetase B [Bacteroidetes bacterium]|nr:asparagine synthetase B [Bacteroidota bacterium]
MSKRIVIGLLILLNFSFKQLLALYILIPMDENQRNHLKAYGITYWVIDKGGQADWLLNYRGGSFAMKYLKDIESECAIRGVTIEVLADGQYSHILSEIADAEVNMDLVKLEKAPKIAVYSPKTKQPWDDAVTMVLTHAEIPYDVIYDQEILTEKLPKYNWLHLHHEDFSGQYGKFYANYNGADWYMKEQEEAERIAKEFGYSKVSQLKLAVTKKIKDFVTGGGFLFAMCSATDSYDIALAAEGTDICDYMFDGDPPEHNCQSKLDFSKTFAFKDFTLEMNPYIYEYSNIDATTYRQVPMNIDYFTLFDFSAKWDMVPAMLTQNHTKTSKGFKGQTTAFRKQVIKSNILVMGENKQANEARYIHGNMGLGMWTFYAGHDPEDYQHLVGDPKTDLNLHPNSPGYRLILNNVLFPAAKKKNKRLEYRLIEFCFERIDYPKY